jgi:CheY-like chemotaxis protein
VYGIVKQNDGFINVYSEPDQGTTFRIYLSRHKGAQEQAMKESKAAPDARGNETVLLVEDEPTILRMTTMMLDRLGYRVLAADNPEQAIALAEAYADKIHLMITDVVLPEMNGRELAARMREIHPEIKVLFMSGYTADVIAHRGVLDKGVNFIQKPFSKKDLADKVRGALDEGE